MNNSIPEKGEQGDGVAEEARTGGPNPVSGGATTSNRATGSRSNRRPRTGNSRSWPAWVAGTIILALFSNWIFPRVSVAFDMIGNFQLQLVLVALVLAVVQFWRRTPFFGGGHPDSGRLASSNFGQFLSSVESAGVRNRDASSYDIQRLECE